MKSWDNFIFNNSLFLIFALFTCSSFAQEKLAPGIYLIRFTDKNSNQYQLSQPESFLSPRALLRRHQQQIVLKNNDLPVSALYIDSLRKLGFTILNSSKWHNAVTVLVSDTSIFRKLDNVSFVKPYVKSKSIITPSFPSNKLIANYSIVKSQLTDFYGLSYDQIAIHHGDFLHSLGYQGQGMLIAVIDAGFNNAQNMSCFDTLWMENRVSLERDTYNPNASVFTEDSHGSEVLSTMAATFPGNLVGTAPKANYLLLRSENATYEANGRQYEYPVEEFNWTVAAELADSIGADIISTSLGYSQFNDSTLNHTYKDMNGHTTLVSIGASIAASKGMIVVVSAGNEGANPWKYITAPADADSILTVGAIDSKGSRAAFSSMGPTADGRVKPDVVAVGYKTIIQTPNNAFVQGYGTSFSAPIIAGLTACLWQSLPFKTNMEIINAIRQSSSQYSKPDSLLGYGIPDFIKAYYSLDPLERSGGKGILVWPNPFSTEFSVEFGPVNAEQALLSIYDMTGKKIFEKRIVTVVNKLNFITIHDIEGIARGICILKITNDSQIFISKILKL